jgi:hypothetical protein
MYPRIQIVYQDSIRYKMLYETYKKMAERLLAFNYNLLVKNPVNPRNTPRKRPNRFNRPRRNPHRQARPTNLVDPCADF